MKYYLAGPWFTDEQARKYRDIVQYIKSNILKSGDEIFIPAEHEVPGAWDLSNQEWGERVFEMDLQALDAADEVIVLDYGYNSDAGTAWEAGYAYAKRKQVTHIRCGDGAIYSLMMANGCDSTDSLLYLLNDFGIAECYEVK